MECAIFHKKRSAKRNNKESTIIFSIDILKQLKCRNGIYLFNESNIVEIIISLDMHMHEQILTFSLVWAFLLIFSSPFIEYTLTHDISLFLLLFYLNEWIMLGCHIKKMFENLLSTQFLQICFLLWLPCRYLMNSLCTNWKLHTVRRKWKKNSLLIDNCWIDLSISHAKHSMVKRIFVLRGKIFQLR